MEYSTLSSHEAAMRELEREVVGSEERWMIFEMGFDSFVCYVYNSIIRGLKFEG